MGTGFAKKKKQARMMQDQLTKMQSTMQNVEITGSAANGLVTITMNGEYEIKAVKIKPECVDPEDVEGLQDLIKSAFKDALDKIQAHSMQQMPKGMPGFLG
jgi:DNA-binding YbaB/EbfC family protein